jgi:photosystem II stability/assembly factor-like uncharacterized protein
MNGPYSPSNITAIAGSATFCIASLDNSDIFTSTDGGLNWQLVDSIAPIDPLTFVLDGTTVFAGTHQGVYGSTDGGKNWVREDQGMSDTDVYQLALYQDTLYAATSTGLFSTYHKNLSWSAIDAGLPVSNWPVSAIAISDSEYFTSVYNVLYITDRKSASPIAHPVAKNIVHVTALGFIDGSLLAAASNGYTYRSTNNGVSWTPGAGLSAGTDPLRMSAAGNLLIASIRNIIYRSADTGSSWYILDTLFRNSNSKAGVLGYLHQESNIVVSGGAIYVGTSYGVYRSLDQGASWLPMNDGLQESIVYELADIDGALFASTQSAVYKFLPANAKWEVCTAGVTGVAQARLVALGSNIFMLETNGVYRSTDTGSHWESFNNNLPISASPMMTTIGGDLVAVVGSNALYFSEDSGTGWEKLSGVLPANNVTALVGFHSLLFVGLSDSGLYRSRDSGKTWEQIDQGIRTADPYILILALAVVDSILCCTTEYGVYLSTDFGDHWYSTDSGTGGIDLSCFTNDGGKILAANDGVWSYDPRSLSVHPLLSQSLSSLDVSYPNPTNDLSQIGFTLDASSRTRLTVVDELGREVVTLIDGNLSAGKHSATLNAYAFPNGVYLCRLTANGQSTSTKLVIRH